MEPKIVKPSGHELVDAIRRCNSMSDMEACRGCPYQQLGSTCQQNMMLDAADLIEAGLTMRKPEIKEEPT